MATTAHPPRAAERQLMRAAVEQLAGIERPSASDGERDAARSLAARLEGVGAPAVVEDEPAHGGYWWPLGLPNGVAALAALGWGRRAGSRTRRLAAAVAGILGAAAVWDDVSGGRLWLRRALPRRTTANVVARAGDAAADRTLVFVAHHDAAHTGLVFHPAISEVGPRYLPRLHARATRHVPIMFAVWLGPALLAAAAASGSRALRRLAAAFSLGTVAAMADIGARATVPGANDNLSGVAVLLGLASRLAERPVDGVRVLLVSTGSEESFMEGMQGFVRRHREELDPARTEVVCLECVGSPHLHVLEGEGMLRMRDYTSGSRDALAEAAERAGVEVGRGLRTVLATDALIALRAGLPAATLCAIDEKKLPSRYHWPDDVPEHLSWPTIEAALDVCWSLVGMRAA